MKNGRGEIYKLAKEYRSSLTYEDKLSHNLAYHAFLRGAEAMREILLRSENTVDVSASLSDKSAVLHAVRKWNADHPSDAISGEDVAEALGKRIDSGNYLCGFIEMPCHSRHNGNRCAFTTDGKCSHQVMKES